MSQIEQDFRDFLAKRPEIERCYQMGLINRRSLARFIIKEGIAKPGQMEAAIAMLRRYGFKKIKEAPKDLFRGIKVNIKDRILLLDFEKEKGLLEKLQKLISHTDYDKGDTLKIVIGSSSIKIFIDEEKERSLKEIFKGSRLKNRMSGVSEIGLIFPEDAIRSKGIISAITRQLFLNDINITEILTSSPELLIYLEEEYVLKAYEIIKGMQR